MLYRVTNSMSSEYRTIRVPPEVYERVLSLQKRASEVAMASMPSQSSGRSMVTIGQVVGDALDLYERWMDANGPKAPA